MSGFNGSGTFQISGVGLPYVTGTVISSSVVNQLNTDFATGLSTCILKDGTQSVTANIPFNNYNINNISAIGIGTTSPLYPLHIKSGATDLFAVNSTGQTTAASFIPTSSTVPTNGMYLSAANTLAFATNSAIKLSIDSAGNSTTTGTNTSASFVPTSSTAPTNGMYLSAADTLSFATNSAIKFSIDSSGNTTTTGNSTTTGTNTSASFIPTSSTVPTNGMYLSSANNLSFATNSAVRLLISSSGAIQATSSIQSTSYIPTGTSVPSSGIYKPNLGVGIANGSSCRLLVASNTYTSTDGVNGTGSTSMTTGFFYIPAAAGIPTGTPSAVSGAVPMYYDTTNNNFYVYNGAWKKVALT